MSNEMPSIPDLSGAEVERMQQNLMAEIARVDDGPAVIVRFRRPIALLSAAACVVVVLIVSLLSVSPSNEEHPAELLASVTSAIDKSTNTVLYARETRYDGPNSTLTSEAWADRSKAGIGRVRGVDANGQPLVDSASAPQGGKTVRTDVVYSTRTVHVSGDEVVTVAPVLPVDATEVRKTEIINGEKTRPILGNKDGGLLEVWVREKDDLPIRAASVTATGLVVVDYEWLPRTEDSLASLVLPIPADFVKSDQPLPADQAISTPGEALKPLKTDNQTLDNLVNTALPAQISTNELPEPTAPTTLVSPTTAPSRPQTTNTTTPATVPPTSTPTTAVGGSGQPRPTTPSTVAGDLPQENDKITFTDSFTADTDERTCFNVEAEERLPGVHVTVRTCIGMRRTTTPQDGRVGLKVESTVFELYNGQTYATHSYVIAPLELSWEGRNGGSGSTSYQRKDVNSFTTMMQLPSSAPQLKGAFVVEVYKNDNKATAVRTIQFNMFEYG